MAWFWGGRQDDDNSDDDEYSYYTGSSASEEDDDDDQRSFYTEGEEIDTHSLQAEEAHQDDHDSQQQQQQQLPTTSESTPATVAAADTSSTTTEDGLRSAELVELLGSSSAQQSPSPPAHPHHRQQAPTTGDAVIFREHDDSSDSSDNHSDDELLQSGAIPAVVVHGRGGRERLPSAISLEDEDDQDRGSREEEEEDEDQGEPQEQLLRSNDHSHGEDDFQKEEESLEPNNNASDAETSEDEEEELVTSTAEKQSLLLLAAENDRVDILQAILNDETERDLLLNPVDEDEIVTTVPPLHMAVSYGSIHTINCLLRMGADPSLRPNVQVIKERLSENSVVENIPHLHRFDGWSAWELAFGSSTKSSKPTEQQIPEESSRSGSWLFGRSSSSLLGGNNNNHDDSTRSFGHDMPPSKREGIRHAFTAEALRCIGSDEVLRLRQLLAAGMPPDIDIGGKTLREWAVDLEAAACRQELVLRLQQQQPAAAGDGDCSENQTAVTTATNGTATSDMTTADADAAHPEKRKSAVLDRGSSNDESSIPALANRLDELESLAQALSTCLDNLAEEVSVCSGLLLVGSGASALASHVRSLKAQKERKLDELERLAEAWENSEDELAYWVKQLGPAAEEILAQAQIVSSSRSKEKQQVPLPAAASKPPPESHTQPSGAETQESDPLQNNKNNDNDEAVQQHRQQLKAQIGAMQHKNRMLRASIADLSEENSRNLDEVERRGLSGGIKLVRGLRDEIREIEFELSECKSGEAACRAKISLLHQARTKQPAKSKTAAAASTDDAGQAAEPTQQENAKPAEEEEANHEQGSAAEDYEHVAAAEAMPESERIATGHSTAIVVRPNNPGGSFLPASIWRIFLRIIGLSHELPRPPPPPHSNNSEASSSVMIL